MSTELANELDQLNKISEIYDDGPFDRCMRSFMMRSLEPFLIKGKALEMGCFNGLFTQQLSNNYEDLTVIDAVPTFLNHAHHLLGSRIKTICTLFETYETDERYDAIFIVHVLEHLQDPVLVLNKARDLLTPLGRIYLIVPNGTAASRQIAVKMGVLPRHDSLSIADIKHGHRRIYFLDSLVREALDAKLRILHTGGIFFKPLANFQFDRLMGGELISDSFMEGCYLLGKEHPTLCASIFSVCTR